MGTRIIQRLGQKESLFHSFPGLFCWDAGCQELGIHHLTAIVSMYCATSTIAENPERTSKKQRQLPFAAMLLVDPWAWLSFKVLVDFLKFDLHVHQLYHTVSYCVFGCHRVSYSYV